ncbi:MAG: asparagine synthase-related protein [Candidatus Methanomethylophilus sp.]|nr:asparagine synthase-related protein [Methanomethylophilus sp.]MDD3232650.1 asparagine synthase-related protein [Methanomethylophilus sp.]MDD4668524.1 asparagine synthase-related protein [Methanomethylophilus sp.]
MFRYAELRDTLVSVIRTAVAGKDVAVACSGGLDSGLVAALAQRYARSVHLYTCGTPDACDVRTAQDLAARLQLPHTRAALTPENTAARLKELIAATGNGDPFTLSYELQLFCVCREAAEEIVLTGQGADEYFMGCAKYVGCSDEEYGILTKASVDRLLQVSVPCEKQIAVHFGKTLVYPYLDPAVTAAVGRLDPADLRPVDLDSRKRVLRETATDLGFPFLAERRKKSSQYGSGTTDLVRGLAKAAGMQYNEYVASLCAQVGVGIPDREWGALVIARIDPVVKEQAEKILRERGTTPAAAVEGYYRSVIASRRDHGQ